MAAQTKRRKYPAEPSSSSSGTVGHTACRSASDVLCFCGMKCDLRRARTSRNYGRMFHGCPLYRENRSCGFFIWVDASDGETNVGRGLMNNGDSSIQALQRQTDYLEEELMKMREEMVGHLNAHHCCKIVKCLKGAC